MGIKNLNKFLKNKCPEIFSTIHLSNFAYKKIVIDVSLYLHKYKAVCGENWLSAFVNLIISLRRNNIHICFIFDGQAIPEKAEEHHKRKEEKEKLQTNVNQLEEALEEYYQTNVLPPILVKLYQTYTDNFPPRLLGKTSPINIDWIKDKIKKKKNQIINISAEDFEELKELFTLFAIPFLTAPGEAEKFGAKLCLDGIVDAILTDDTDVIAYGAPSFLTKIDTALDTCTMIIYNDILENLNINSSMMLDLCIMCGTDYNTNINKIGAHNAYKNLLKYGSIENIASQTSLDTSVIHYTTSREIFTTFSGIDTPNIPYSGRPNYSSLHEFFVQKNININIEKIKKIYQPNILITE